MSSRGQGRNVYGISRDLWDHPVFRNEPYTEKQAWAWLIGAAAWKGKPTRGNAGPVSLSRGEFSFSIRFLGEKWDWPKSSVDRFLAKLMKHGMIRDTSRDGSKIYFINNYNDYQLIGLPTPAAERDATGTEAGQQRDKEETGKQGNKKERKKMVPTAPGVLPGLEFPPWWPTEAWAAFVDMRKKMKKPLTDRAVELIVKALTEFRKQGQDPQAIIDQSLRKSWQDVYPLKADAQGGYGGGAAASGGAGAPAPTVTLEIWLWRLQAFYLGKPDEDLPVGYWLAKWGPKPGEKGCLAPPEAMRRFRAGSPSEALL